MAIVFREKNYNDDVALYELDGNEMEQCLQLGFNETISSVENIASKQKQQHRLATSLLLYEMTGMKLNIQHNEHGKPFISGSERKISVSNSRNFVAVMLSNESTGVDIQIIQPKIIRIAHKFMSDKEMSQLDKNEFIEHLLIYWSAKEAIYKAYGREKVSFRQNISIEPFSFNRKGNIKGYVLSADENKEYKMKYEFIKGCVLVYIYNSQFKTNY
jgi:phosphopantetheinyl transferase